MPTLIVENVPADVYERLQKRAANQRRSLPEEMLHMLERLLKEDDPHSLRLPDLIQAEEVSAPEDLPRSSQPVPITARTGSERLPDALPEEPEL